MGSGYGPINVHKHAGFEVELYIQLYSSLVPLPKTVKLRKIKKIEQFG